MKTFLLVLFKSIEISAFIFISFLISKMPFNLIIWGIIGGICLLYIILTFKTGKELISYWIKWNKKLINKILKK